MTDAPPSPPHSIEAEQAILGVLMRDTSGAWRHVSGRLTAEHFHDPVHGRIFAAVERMAERGADAGPGIIATLMRDDAGLAEFGGSAYLVRMCAAILTAAALPDYVQLVRDSWARREIIRIADEAAGKARTDRDEATPDSIAAEIETGLSALGEATTDRPVRVGLATALAEAMSIANIGFQAEASGDDDAAPRIPTGWAPLDSLIGGFRPGEFIVVGGATSMGKSVVGTEIARSAAKRGVGVVMWGGEMTPADLSMRLACAEMQDRTGECLPYGLAMDGRMSEGRYRTLLETARGMERLPITLIEPGVSHVDRVAGEITRGVRRWRAEGRKALVVVDYLQLLRAEGRSGYERVSGVSTALKALTIRLRVPVVAMAQLSRSREIWPNNRPGLADLRESGQIEQDANTCLFVYRDDYYLDRMLQAAEQSASLDVDEIDRLRAALDRARGKLDLIVAKQRSGPLGTATVNVDLRTSRVWAPAEAARQHHQQEAF